MQYDSLNWETDRTVFALYSLLRSAAISYCDWCQSSRWHITVVRQLAGIVAVSTVIPV